MDIRKLNQDSHDLLEQLADRIPDQPLRACRSFDKAGERSELLELISATLLKEAIPVTPAERDALADLLHRYPIPMEGYDHINNRDKTIAALTIVQG